MDPSKCLELFKKKKMLEDKYVDEKKDWYKNFTDLMWPIETLKFLWIKSPRKDTKSRTVIMVPSAMDFSMLDKVDEIILTNTVYEYDGMSEVFDS